MVDLFEDDKMFHLHVKPEQVGKYVILPGDPGRAPKIAAYLDHAEEVAYHREYRTYTGALNGVAVSVVSTGIGGPSAAIAVEELVACGCHTFIRVGTSGGMREDVLGGDLVVATAAVRSEGTTQEYLPAGYPAAADFTLVEALAQAGQGLSCDRDGCRCHVGVVHSKDSFYGEVAPETMPIADSLVEQWLAYVKSGCLTSEMECAAIFAVGLARQVRCGAVLNVLWNAELSRRGIENPVSHSTERGIRCAIEALKILIAKEC